MHRLAPATVLAAALLACLFEPAATAAQEAAARACADEVWRLEEAFPLDEATGEQAAAIAQEPSARKGAALESGQRRRVGDLIRQARAAAERDDGQACLQGLAEARALLREAGVGGGQPGLATSASPGTGSSRGGAAGGGGGSSTTPPSGLAPAAGGGGALSGTGGGTAGGATGGGSGSGGGGGS